MIIPTDKEKQNTLMGSEIMLIHKDTQSMKYSKDKSRVYQLNVGNNETVTAKKKKKKSTLGPVGLKKGENKLYKLTITVRQTYVELENSIIIPQNRETAQNHRERKKKICDFVIFCERLPKVIWRFTLKANQEIVITIYFMSFLQTAVFHTEMNWKTAI